MLLRRITEHVREQNWFAVGIDLLVVIFGVYVGMQVSVWNEERLERLEEIEFLERIIADLDASIELQIGSEQFQQNGLDNADWIIALLDKGEIPEASQESFNKQLYELARTNPLLYRLATIEEMTAAGKLGLIQNTDVRSTVGQLLSFAKQRQTLLSAIVQQKTNFTVEIRKFIARRPDSDGSYIYEYNKDELFSDHKVRNAILNARGMAEAILRFSKQFTARLKMAKAVAQEEYDVLTRMD